MKKQLVGNKPEEPFGKPPKDLLPIQHYLSANCFGDFYTRDGLDLQLRKLVTLAFLAAPGGTEAQIKGHISGNARMGNNRRTLINVLTQLLPCVGYPRMLHAVACLNEVLPAQPTAQ